MSRTLKGCSNWKPHQHLGANRTRGLHLRGDRPTHDRCVARHVPPPATAKRNARRPNPAATEAELTIARALAAPLEEWYQAHGRSFPWRLWNDPYRLLTVEILLQRTQAESVARWVSTFYETYPDWPALATANPVQLRELLRPLGLHDRRSRALLDLARLMVSSRHAAPKLPGVGQYVERAIGVTSRGERLAMVDSNFVRVVTRIFGGEWMADYRHDRRLQMIVEAIVSSARQPTTVNWAILDLGAAICRPRSPNCEVCPLLRSCLYRSSVIPT
jgi:A/G-specific adenine glycosylase